jgi:hypothetical protein
MRCREIFERSVGEKVVGLQLRTTNIAPTYATYDRLVPPSSCTQQIQVGISMRPPHPLCLTHMNRAVLRQHHLPNRR